MTAAMSPMGSQPLMKSIMSGDASMGSESSSGSAEKVREEMAQRVLWGAWPPRPGETQEGMLARFARKAGIPFGRIKRLRYREVRIIPAHEADDIRAITGSLKALRERMARLEAETSRGAPVQLDLPLFGEQVRRRGGVDQ